VPSDLVPTQRSCRIHDDAPLGGAPCHRPARSHPPWLHHQGNGGYDAQHYDLDLALDISQGAIISATTTIDALALVDLCTFNLDFESLTVSAVSVNGDPSTHVRRGKELTIALEEPFKAGTAFTVEVSYHGTPIAASYDAGSTVPGDTPVDEGDGTDGADPDEDSALRGGWFTYEDEIFALGEPTGNRFWYPVNEHPADKATYTANYTVAKPFEVVANGSPVERIDYGAITTYVWDSRDPIASYLVTFHAGMLEREELTTADGLPIGSRSPQTCPTISEPSSASSPR
jgi:aminopeptidase N